MSIRLALVAIILSLRFSSIAVADEQRQVTVCERHWYCAWLCKTCSSKTQWCYDFSSIHTSCRLFVEILHGCEKDKEFKWYAGCFGWVSACLSARTRCFDNPLTTTGACSTSVCSAPDGPIESRYSVRSSSRLIFAPLMNSVSKRY